MVDVDTGIDHRPVNGLTARVKHPLCRQRFDARQVLESAQRFVVYTRQIHRLWREGLVVPDLEQHMRTREHAPFDFLALTQELDLVASQLHLDETVGLILTSRLDAGCLLDEPGQIADVLPPNHL